MGNKPLTPPMVLLALIWVPGLVFLIFAWGGDIDMRLRPVGKHGLLALIPVAAALLVWHKGVYGRADRLADELARRVPPDVILQAEAVHLAVLCEQRGAFARLHFLAQNRYDRATTLSLDLLGPLPVPRLACNLPASELVHAVVDVPASVLSGGATVHFQVLASSPRPRGGRLVHFARHQAAVKPMRMWVAFLSLGHVLPGDGTRICFTLAPTADTGEQPQFREWHGLPRD